MRTYWYTIKSALTALEAQEADETNDRSSKLTHMQATFVTNRVILRRLNVKLSTLERCFKRLTSE